MWAMDFKVRNFIFGTFINPFCCQWAVRAYPGQGLRTWRFGVDWYREGQRARAGAGFAVDLAAFLPIPWGSGPIHFSRKRVSAIRDPRETHRLQRRLVGPGSPTVVRRFAAGKNGFRVSIFTRKLSSRPPAFAGAGSCPAQAGWRAGTYTPVGSQSFAVVPPCQIIACADVCRSRLCGPPARAIRPG